MGFRSMVILLSPICLLVGMKVKIAAEYKLVGKGITFRGTLFFSLNIIQ